MMKSIPPAIRIAALITLAVVVSACAHASRRNSGHVGSSGFYEGVIGFYSGPLNHLSGVRRGGCPMHPSCSQYSKEAVKRNGFVNGWVMTMDRLLRCGRDELKTAPRVFVDGQWKYYDPVVQNEISTRPAEDPQRFTR
jgi:hypothetical protein